MALPEKFTEELDAELRTAAMDWLTNRSFDGDIALSYLDLEEFIFRGYGLPLRNRYKGIWKPRQLSAALSFTTAFRKPGQERPYEDGVGDDGMLRYKWNGDDSDHADNRALRAAWQQRKPLIWFHGVAQGMYQPIFPTYLIDEEVNEKQFAFTLDGLQDFIPGSATERNIRKAYAKQEILRRVHQPVFRSMVLTAYEGRCAVCSLAHTELLDAAHIVPDHDADGIPAVRNGLAMCKIHHTAYDKSILGISPDLTVKIRTDILNEVDGPMLRYGLQERHDQRLMVIPKSRIDRPAPELLQRQWNLFKLAV